MRLLHKSEAAWLLSFQTFWERCNGRGYFWTFTPRSVCSDRQFSVAFHTFWHAFDRWFNDAELEGLRVYERFHGGGDRDGDLHCHLVCNRRLPAKGILRWARGTGIGWVHVRKCVPSDGEYLAKYLCKDDCPKQGVRTWARLGTWRHTKKNNIIVSSKEADLFREAYRQTGSWAGARQYLIQQDAMLNGRCGSFKRVCQGGVGEGPGDVTTYLNSGLNWRETSVKSPEELEKAERHAWFADRIGDSELLRSNTFQMVE